MNPVLFILIALSSLAWLFAGMLFLLNMKQRRSIAFWQDRAILHEISIRSFKRRMEDAQKDNVALVKKAADAINENQPLKDTIRAQGDALANQAEQIAKAERGEARALREVNSSRYSMRDALNRRDRANSEASTAQSALYRAQQDVKALLTRDGWYDDLNG